MPVFNTMCIRSHDHGTFAVPKVMTHDFGAQIGAQTSYISHSGAHSPRRICLYSCHEKLDRCAISTSVYRFGKQNMALTYKIEGRV
jgi:hypothetical protein